MNHEYDILIAKLDTFIRKYYKNQIIRGILLALSIYLAFFLTVSALEYFGHFSITVRSVLFYFTIGLIVAILAVYIIVPLLGYFRIGRVISHKQAAEIISRHFIEVQDKLLNILELVNLENEPLFSRDLVLASIDQKIGRLKPIRFTNAINIRQNFRFARILAAIVIVFILTLIIVPSLITEGTNRLVKHSTYFEPEAPFHYTLLNDSLYVQKGDDYEVKVGLDGKYIPENVSILIGGNSFTMSKISKTKFSYVIRNINNAIDFAFMSENIESRRYHLAVLPSPVILDFSVSITVPAYTGETNRVLKNVGDITVPFGSSVKWEFVTRDIGTLDFRFNDSLRFEATKNGQGFSFSKAMFESCRYSISASNEFFRKNDIIRYSVSVIPDLYPNINVVSVKDSTKNTVFYYNGNISDDYGFSRLAFVYNLNGSKDTLIDIPVIKNTVSQEFYYAFDFASINLKASDKIEYYFEVWDNDAINGAKSARSSVYEYKVPSADELKQISDETNKDVESKIAESMKLANNIRKEIKDLKEKNVNENLSSWEKTHKLENINQMHNRLEQLLNQLSKENEMKNDMMNSFTQQEQNIMEKQKQIDDLLKNVMNDDLKKLMDELQKMMENFDKDKFNDLTQKLDMSYEDLSKQLDRNIDILKKYQIEENIRKTVDEMKQLAKDQDKLSEEVKDKNADKNDLLNKQNEQNEKFNKSEKEYNEDRKLNNELKEPMQMNDFKEEMQDINDEFKQGSENMKNNEMKKASGGQKKNSKKLNDLAQSMDLMMNNNSAAQEQEGMEDLRQVLKNILTFSFDDEDLMNQTDMVDQKDPRYAKVINRQKELTDDYSIIRDSLDLLCKKTPELGSMVTKEMYNIDKELKESRNRLDEHNTNQARVSQQYVMTSANNLALLLSEALKQMESNMQMQGTGSKSCKKKKGSGAPSMAQMKSMQESLKQQLQDMIDMMKKGQGQGNKQDQNSLNKRLAQMLAQQEIFQQMMSEMSQSQSLMPETQRMMNEINNLIKQNENDLVNKNITPQTMQRQNQILTRLLEAENSEKQREIDKKRESREPEKEILRNPADIFPLKGINTNFSELLNVTNLKMTDYYKKKYKEYMLQLNE
ncbi:MAG: hypothetical protein NTW49_14360 [Bacteroidia bacterium]|nr:hypothetical protein [Bacteroidia bacterium]